MGGRGRVGGKSLNRTFMELKFEIDVEEMRIPLGLNRTFMELK